MAIEQRVITSMPEFLLMLEAGFTIHDSMVPLTYGPVDNIEMLNDLSRYPENLPNVTRWVERGDYYVEAED